MRILEFVPFVSIFLAMRTLRRMREVQAAAAAGTPILPPPVPEPPPPPVRALTVAVLIAMPAPHRLSPRAGSGASCAYDPLAPIAEERRRDSAGSGKTRGSGGGPGSGPGGEAEDDAPRVYAIGIAQVPWDAGEVDLS